MNQQRKLIATLVVAAILGGLSSMGSANSGETSGDTRTEPQAAAKALPVEVREDSQPRTERTSGIQLSLEQMDQIHAGMINNESPPPVPPYGSDGRGVTCRHLSCYGL